MVPTAGAARGRAAVAALSIAAVLGGCSSTPGGDQAAETVADFYQAVLDQDAVVACRMLAPATIDALEDSEGPCADSLLVDEVGERLAEAAEESGGPQEPSTTVAGRHAQVVFGDEATFLVVSGAGWRISAAGCEPRPERPYDCVVEGA